MEKVKKNKIGFQLIGIVTRQFAIIEDVFDKNIKQVSFSVNVDFGINNSKKIISTTVKVQFYQNKSVFLIVEISNHFIIEQSAWNNLKNDKEKIIIKKDFATHLLVLTIGTIRGVLHAKTENTEFNNFILPTLNVSELIDTDIEININDKTTV